MQARSAGVCLRVAGLVSSEAVLGVNSMRAAVVTVMMVCIHACPCAATDGDAEAGCQDPCTALAGAPRLDDTGLAGAAWDALSRAAAGYVDPFPTMAVVARGSGCGVLGAVACPDGSTYVTQEALDLCASTGETAGACVAFVLAHELGHHAQFVAMGSRKWEGKDFLAQLGTPDLEDSADARGVFFLALAGIDPTRIASLDVVQRFYGARLEAQSWQAKRAARRVEALVSHVEDLWARAVALRGAILLAMFRADRTATALIGRMAEDWMLPEAYEWKGFLEARVALATHPLAEPCGFIVPAGSALEAARQTAAMRGDAEKSAATRLMTAALKSLTRAAELHGEAKGRAGARVANNLGCVQHYLGRKGTAGDLLAQAIELAQGGGSDAEVSDQIRSNAKVVAGEKAPERAATPGAQGKAALSCKAELDALLGAEVQESCGGEAKAEALACRCGPGERTLASVPAAGPGQAAASLLACEAGSGVVRFRVESAGDGPLTMLQAKAPRECRFTPGGNSEAVALASDGTTAYLVDEELLVFVSRSGEVESAAAIR